MNGNNRYYDASGHGESRAPVSVGEELDVTIEAVGEKGDGIAKKQGFVLFVPNTNEGDRVKIKVTKVLRKVGFAEVIGKAEEIQAETEGSEQEEGGAAEEEQQYEDTEDFGEEEGSEAGDESAPEGESQPEESGEAEEEKKEE